MQMSRAVSLGETIGRLYGRDWLRVGDQELERALLELFDPEVVLVPEPGAPPDVKFVGIPEIARLLASARHEWKGCRYLVDEVSESPGGRVVVTGRLVADLRHSGSRVSLRFAHRWSTRGGRVVKVEAL
jgi:ketosteroid isomerase-like protein